ncbi:hypothetical protein [Microbacterium maritypicum]|uniref:Uncharacterized protein n=1 Tax=Microbacterium maritypicum MF109 TaxID=1333857 RepID=T5KH82_MICMQ|nr:hypothetical protein [Microbacterium liquefaciens]EQM74824.1 hypothetical protein L687_05025 [Microbacterium maritypicum MF109]
MDTIRYNGAVLAAVLWSLAGTAAIISCITMLVRGDHPVYLFGVLGGLLMFWFAWKNLREAQGKTSKGD